MRTTVSIDDQLLANAKQRAQERGETLGQYVEYALRNQLVGQPVHAKPIQFPTFSRGTGMRTTIDPSSNSDLFDALDASGDVA